MAQNPMTRRLFVVALTACSGVAGIILSASPFSSSRAWAESPDVAPVNVLTADEIKDSFQLLFDGSTFQGWHGYGGNDITSKWVIRDGVLAINPVSDKRSDLVTDGEYENFELRIDWSISVGGNSGVMFNVAETPEFGKPWRTGPEVQILDKDSSEGHRTGDLYDLVPGEVAKSNPAGEWNESRLLVEDGLVRHWLNGSVTFEVQMWSPEWDELVAKSKFKSMPSFGTYRRGHIVLQDHGDFVRFRTIRIREL